jgi:3-oxosteroid 1-dehydrogenase
LPQSLTYDETIAANLYRHPIAGSLRSGLTFLHRWTTSTAGKGNALITGLLKGCLDHGCRIELSARAVRLLTDEKDDSVKGVVVERVGQRIEFTAKKGVVLATGGADNAAMSSAG